MRMFSIRNPNKYTTAYSIPLIEREVVLLDVIKSSDMLKRK